MTTNFEGLLRWRCIGPFRGGRVVTVAGDPVNKATFYFGACAGGVWKTEDGGSYWENISDGFFNTAAVGALAVAPSDPNVIYAGTGETSIRIDVSHGDGMYKSVDAGRSWSHIGLKDSRFIGKIAVHPQNPDILYVAALGHAFGRNEERGVFRSVDGGKSWEKVLYKSDKAGAVDVRLDPNNPRILYATIWEAYRNFWQISSGGEESGIYRSMDGGDSWEELSGKNGLPAGILGKMGVAPSPAQPGRVWALIESVNDPGLYRSDNYGDKWERVSDNGELYARSWYYVHLTADPVDGDTVYVNCYKFWKSIDAGKNFTEIDTPHGDNHDLWIDPQDNQRMVQGNDGGANVSYNGGASWSTIYNQPTAQFYHIAADNQTPYHVYGTQQDNSSLAVPSARRDVGAIPWSACYMAGSGESGYIAIHPEDYNIVYVGAIGSSPGGGNALQRYDHRTKRIRLIANWPLYDGGGGGTARYRFAWTYPILLSPHDPNVIYIAGNRLFRSVDEGHSWEAISPDLTRNDPDKMQPSGGLINRDAFGAEVYCTIFSFAESPHQSGIFWAGSDDGLLHLSHDNGTTWHDITPPDLPEWTMINGIELSTHEAQTAYLCATRYKLDDYAPYLYKTTDMGKSWRKIVAGIRPDDFTRVIREDPARAGLLYAGTETGLYISMDSGGSWHPFQLNLPVSPIHDLILKNDDLIAGTHGRSIWILDDVTPIHQQFDQANGDAPRLFKPRDTQREMEPLFADWAGGKPGKNYTTGFTETTTFYEEKTPEGVVDRRFIDVGENPPAGVIISYYLPAKPDKLTLRILDESGVEINQFDKLPADFKREEGDDTVFVPANAGNNRFVWNMRYANGEKIKGKDLSAVKASGPLAPPGTYQVEMAVDGETQSRSFAIYPDPRVDAPPEAYAEQAALLVAIRDKLSETHKMINQLRDLRAQSEGWMKRLGDGAAKDAGKALLDKLQAVEDPLIKPGLKTQSEVVNHGNRLLGQLAMLPPVVASAEFAPTPGSKEVFAKLSAEIDAQLALWEKAKGEELPAFNQALADAGNGALII